jgi:tetratricopeptide (TPR) repeat protein
MKQKTVIFILLLLPFQLFAQTIDELILNKKYDKALDYISAQIQEKPDAGIYFKQALVYRELSNPMLASKALEAALLYEPKNSLILADLGENYALLGNQYQSVECFRQAASLSPENLSLQAKLGKAYISIDDFQRAFQTFETIYRVDSVNPYFNKQFAFSAFRTGKPDLAIRLYEKVIAENPGDFTSHLNLISVYKRKKDVGQVFSSGNRALTIFPKNPTLLLRQADALFELKDYERAIVPYESYLSENDSTYEVLKNYGIALYFFKKEQLAIPMLEKCYAMVADDPFVHFYLGLAYKNMADYERSAEYLLAAIACAQPVYMTEMYHHLGQVYGNNREFEKSIGALKKAYEFNNERVEILFEIATTYEEFDFNKTMALNYYSNYLKTAGEKAKNANYALDRLKKIKEDLFIENK